MGIIHFSTFEYNTHIPHCCHHSCSANKFHIKDGTITGVDAKCTPSSERIKPQKGNGDAVTPIEDDMTKKSFSGDAVVLASGHSARDVYYELHASGVELEPKGFAVGFRIEHPQVIGVQKIHLTAFF